MMNKSKPIKPGKPGRLGDKLNPLPTVGGNSKATTKPKVRKTSQPKPPSLGQQFATKRDKVAQNAIDSAFNAAGKISKAGSKTTIKKGGPRPKMERMAQPMKPKRMAKKGR